VGAKDWCRALNHKEIGNQREARSRKKDNFPVITIRRIYREKIWKVGAVCKNHLSLSAKLLSGSGVPIPGKPDAQRTVPRER